MENTDNLEKIKERFNPFYKEGLSDADAQEILQSMNDLIVLQKKFLQNKNEIVNKIVYNKRVTKYDE